MNLSIEAYEAEARSDHRTYARDHSYGEWCHFMRIHVWGEIHRDSTCSQRRCECYC